MPEASKLKESGSNAIFDPGKFPRFDNQKRPYFLFPGTASWIGSSAHPWGGIHLVTCIGKGAASGKL